MTISMNSSAFYCGGWHGPPGKARQVPLLWILLLLCATVLLPLAQPALAASSEKKEYVSASSHYRVLLLIGNSVWPHC